MRSVIRYFLLFRGIEDFVDRTETKPPGPFLLFQAVYPLLEKSSHPKFVLVGTPVGSIGGMEKQSRPMFAYGASKAMAHYFVRKIHFEHKDIIAFAVDPG